MEREAKTKCIYKKNSLFLCTHKAYIFHLYRTIIPNVAYVDFEFARRANHSDLLAFFFYCFIIRYCMYVHRISYYYNNFNKLCSNCRVTDTFIYFLLSYIFRSVLACLQQKKKKEKRNMKENICFFGCHFMNTSRRLSGGMDNDL